MTRNAVSGCGPGMPYPADTPRDGVATVRKTRDEIESEFRDALFRIHSRLHSCTYCDEYAEWARELQAAADAARKLC